MGVIMSLYIDTKHIQLISSLLTNFKQRDSYLYNFRCNICGDSEKNKRKSRGYFYRIANANYMSMKCHNCGASMKFSSYLKLFFNAQYREYLLEKYGEKYGEKMKNSNKILENEFNYKIEEEDFRKERTLLEMLMPTLDTLPEDNEAVVFCRNRKIPEKAFKYLYYIDDVKKVDQLSPKYKDKIVTQEPRLVIPFYTEQGKLEGVTCRALRGEAFRYISVKISENPSMVFGSERLDRTKKAYVFEGPLDSLFVENGLAVGSTSLSRVKGLNMSKESFVFVLDNQPRNKEVCREYKKFINAGYSLMIWPSHIESKDVNKLVLDHGITDVQSFIDQNTYSGLKALVKFNEWSKV